MRRHTVLLVDDEPWIVEVWTRILFVAGYDVLCAANANEALDVLDEARVTSPSATRSCPGRAA